MSDVIVKMKLTQKQAGALYMKNIALENHVKLLQNKINKIYDECHPEDEDLMGDSLHAISCICTEVSE